VTDTADKYVAIFNDGLPLDAPGCETCGGSIRAVRERIDGVLVAVIDIAHSDAGCPTLAQHSGMRPLAGLKRLLVRHRFDAGGQPMSAAIRKFFAQAPALSLASPRDLA
jgi:hypothetical protein